MASRLSQHNRLFNIDTPLGEDKLLVRRFAGMEAMSSMFRYDVEMVSEDHDLDLDQLLSKPVKLGIRQNDESTFRYFNGYVSRCRQGRPEGQFAVYHAELVPWLWFLTQNQDCYIHQNKKVEDVIKWVFNKFGFRDFDFQLRGTHDQWDYLTQYRESSFGFVSRLFEIEGIFYFWKQQEGKHVLQAADGPHIHENCSYQARFKQEKIYGRGFKRGEDSIFSLEVGRLFRTGKYAHREYNFEKPESELHGETNARVGRAGKSQYEIYDYPGEYEENSEANPWSRLRMEESELEEEAHTGESNARSMCPGYKFEMRGHDRRELNRGYLVTAVYHYGQEENFVPGARPVPPSYTNQFTCLPTDVPYRPARKTPKHVMRGVQTAVVVGPKGEEIYTDKYGRVKVQFHWDRVGKKDEKSSCWMRVSQPWAGKNWGALFLPRIGQEVIVDFLEGDPDRPIITGRVYNANQMPPYELPKNQNWSGIKTRSTKKGSPDNFNEIRFDDTKGKELFWMHAEKDMRITVENDTTEIIDRHRYLTVKGTQTELVGGDKHTTVKEDQFELTEGKRHWRVNGNREGHVGGDDKICVEGNMDINIQQNLMADMRDMNLQVSNLKGWSDSLSFIATGEIVLQATSGLTISCGASFVKLDMSGVYIVGPLVNINSGGAPGTPTSPTFGQVSNPEEPKKPPELEKETPYSTQDAQKDQSKPAAPSPVPPPSSSSPAAPSSASSSPSRQRGAAAQTAVQAAVAAAPPKKTPTEEKKERLDQRKKIIAAGEARVPQLAPAEQAKTKQAIDRLKRNNDAAEMARLAQAAYDDKGAPPGWKRLNDPGEKLPPGLDPKMFHDPDSGFDAALFQSEIDGRTVLAFRGTQEGKDWGANLQQGVGLGATQYSQAIELAQNVKAATGGKLSRITGHSLGGGLTAAASTVTNIPSDSFNAAGVHPATLDPYGKSRAQGDKLVNNHHTRGEVLTGAQETVGRALSGAADLVKQIGAGISDAARVPINMVRRLLGQQVAPQPKYQHAMVAPTAIGRQYELPSVDENGNPVSLWQDLMGGMTKRHSMNVVINGIEQQKREDLGTIAGSL